MKSGTDEAAASFMCARWPVFGIAYRMLGSASEASEKPAALQSTRGPNMFSSHVPGFGAARPGLGCTQQTALLLGSRGGYMLGHFRSTSNQGGLLCRVVRPSLPPREVKMFPSAYNKLLYYTFWVTIQMGYSFAGLLPNLVE